MVYADLLVTVIYDDLKTLEYFATKNSVFLEGFINILETFYTKRSSFSPKRE